MKQLPKRPLHGGALNQQIKVLNNNAYDDIEQWLDLSTGINPNGWPVPIIPAQVYNQLPQDEDGLLEAAQHYYRSNDILPVAGSQEAIQLLPQIFHQHQLLAKKPLIGIISPCYAEHEHHWQRHQFNIIYLNSEKVIDVLDELDVLLIINPNNPTGEVIPLATIKQWLSKMAGRQAYIIIDEAFMDSSAENSALNLAQQEQIIILRSIGKFFGLAGARCGFVIAREEILSLIKYYQPPWSVSGPTRWLVKQALRDNIWIAENIKWLKISAARLEALLTKALLILYPDFSITGTDLFKTVMFDNAFFVYQQLAKQGILVRLLDNKQGLRFALPGNEQQWQQLTQALNKIAPG